MSELSKRQRRIYAQKQIDKAESPFTEINMSEVNHPEWMTRAWRNNKFTVMVSDREMTTHGEAIRIMVQKIDDTPILTHWSTMQRIKNTLFGPETCAVEYYPKASQLIDKHNIYWMWIYPEGVLPQPLNA